MITDFIISNQGCSKEEIVRKLDKFMSRKTIFKLLNELSDVKITRHEREKPNSRNYKIYVDSQNPAVLVPREIQTFQRIFSSLYTAAVSKYDKINKLDKKSLQFSVQLS